MLSALPLTTDIAQHHRYVGKVPKAVLTATKRRAMQARAKAGLPRLCND
jgi:hypothetical protein